MRYGCSRGALMTLTLPAELPGICADSAHGDEPWQSLPVDKSAREMCCPQAITPGTDGSSPRRRGRPDGCRRPIALRVCLRSSRSRIGGFQPAIYPILGRYELSSRPPGGWSTRLRPVLCQGLLVWFWVRVGGCGSCELELVRSGRISNPEIPPGVYAVANGLFL